jgi:cell division protein FtsQ
MRLRTPSPPPDLAPTGGSASEPASDLVAARRRATRRTRLRRGAIAAAVVLLLGGAAWAIGYSDLLVAEKVEVRGVDGPLAVDVESAAAVPMGQPLARVDADETAASVETIPDVATATVTRSWPSTIVVTVTPREPVASLAVEGEWRLVDDEGVLFGSPTQPAGGIPVLVAPATDEGAQARASGVSVAVALPPRVLRQVNRIEATSPIDVRLVLRDGRVVVWGNEQEAERKAEVLSVLLETPATQYDVSVPDRPTLRPVPGS